MTYARMGQRSLDFSLCQYGLSKNIFRGPKKQLNKPFIACFGSTDTFGQTVAAPFPLLLERHLKQPVANFGILNGGLDAILKDPELLALCNNASHIVIQIMGAHSQSNDYYSVHPRRNDRFITAHSKLRDLYPNIDFTEFHFTRHMLSHLETEDPDRFRRVRNHLRQTWQTNMRRLCHALPVKPHILWLSARDMAPRENGLLEADPNFITAGDIDAILPFTRGLISVTKKRSLRKLPSFAVLEEMDQRAHDHCANIVCGELHAKRPA